MFSQEEEILDLLEQCEADENITFDKSGNRPMSKGPKVTKLLFIWWWRRGIGGIGTEGGIQRGGGGGGVGRLRSGRSQASGEQEKNGKIHHML